MLSSVCVSPIWWHLHVNYLKWLTFLFPWNSLFPWNLGKGLAVIDELCGCVCVFVFPIWWHLLLWCNFWQVFPAMVDSAGLLLGVGVTLRVWVYWESPGRPISRRQCRQWVFRNRHHPHILCCVSWPQNILDGGQLQENRSPVWPHVGAMTIFFFWLLISKPTNISTFLTRSVFKLVTKPQRGKCVFLSCHFSDIH